MQKYIFFNIQTLFDDFLEGEKLYATYRSPLLRPRHRRADFAPDAGALQRRWLPPQPRHLFRHGGAGAEGHRRGAEIVLSECRMTNCPQFLYFCTFVFVIKIFMMKKISLTFFFVIIALFCFAQDIIVTTDARRIEAKVLEVSESEVKYKETDNLEGPTFIISTNNISSIVYANGNAWLFCRQHPVADCRL